MFDNLSSRLQVIFSKLRSSGKLNEKQVDEALREVRLALLEADVNFVVVKDFIARIRERAVGTEVLDSLTPGQQVIKIVNDSLVELLGGTSSQLVFSSRPPTVLMLAGLQGSGKTTASAKLAYYLKTVGKRPLLVAADIYRPAAIDQLKSLAHDIHVPVYTAPPQTKPLAIIEQGVKESAQTACDVAILDTAGRLHVDEEMMNELVQIRDKVHPHQIFLVLDAMTGQDAVNLAQVFQEKLDFDGVIMTKLDGDARGGAALSMKAVTGKPIKFVSVGEKIDSLQLFHPDRMASRILGMGDMMTLIEKAEKEMDQKTAAEIQAKIQKADVSLEDFLDQMKQIKKMGPISDILKMIPGVGNSRDLKYLKVSDKDMVRMEAIIESMTPHERRDPRIINGSRRSRIARGSGTTTQEVNQLLKQFAQASKMMKAFGKGDRFKLGI